MSTEARAYDMSRYQRVIGTEGRISGTWIVLSARGRDRVCIRPYDVTIYDETHRSGRILGRDDLLAWVRGDEVDVPKHMVRDHVRDEVDEVWNELTELLKLIARAFVNGPREPDRNSADSGEAER